MDIFSTASWSFRNPPGSRGEAQNLLYRARLLLEILKEQMMLQILILIIHPLFGPVKPKHGI